MRKADGLAEIYNWHAAAPYYAEAEKFFTIKHDMRKALLAHIGYIRATVEQRSFSETARYFSNICDEPLGQTICGKRSIVQTNPVHSV
jgi:hypothetical protein